ncbi:hypothetical protein G6F56_011105 [Rhizopus delemar]|nr:hypothetical protein G6F56_011105 [Rhizopus delemar]
MSAYFACPLCNTFHASDFNTLRSHQRNNCVDSSYHYVHEDHSMTQVPEPENDHLDDSNMNNVEHQTSDDDAMSIDEVSINFSVTGVAAVQGTIVFQYHDPRHMTVPQKASLKIYSKAVQYHVPRQFLRYTAKIINENIISQMGPDANILGGRFPTLDTMNRLLIKTNEDIGMFKDYHFCPRGCYLYPENSTDNQCPNPLCHLPRYVVQYGVTLPIPAVIMSICSIGVVLAEMLLDPSTRPLFGYRAAYEKAHEDGVYTNHYAAECLQNVSNLGDILETSDVSRSSGWRHFGDTMET